MLQRNMSMTKTPIPSQDPKARRGNFEEVCLGYTLEMANEEARRCLVCTKKPCQSGCPVGVDIPHFIHRLADGDLEGAFDVLAESSALPAVCGRVCPQESQCEARCTRGIKGEAVAIGRLERFVADWHRENCRREHHFAPSNGKKVAVVGAGPSGLTCAGDLAKHGCSVTIFEALHEPGGVLIYGIPEFRLPKRIVRHEIEGLREIGVTIETNVVVGKTVTVDELLEEEGFDAVYLASGAGLPRFMNIPGETLRGVYSANEYLTRVNLMGAYRPKSKTPILRGRRVAVVGGGNVAMDAARCALRLGAEEVTIVYRRSMEELPARKEEVEHAMEEGIVFRTLTNPKEILGDETGAVAALRCAEMELGEPGPDGRRRPVEKPESELTIPAEVVIMALGTSPNPLLQATTPGLETNSHGCIVTKDEGGATSRKGVFAGGDAVTGAATVILAMGAGKTAAAAILEYLKG